IAAVHLGALGHVDTKKLFALQLGIIDGEVGGRCKLLGIVDGGDNVLAYLSNRVLPDALHGSVIRHPQQQGASMAIQKSAHGFVHRSWCLVTACLELEVESFTSG